MRKTIAVTAVVLAGAVAVAIRPKPSGCVAARDERCKRQMRAVGDRSAGAYYFGAGNSFPAREAVGECEPMPPDSCSGGEP